jgi:LAO/AO transport system kinase
MTSDPKVLAAEIAGGSTRALARGLTWVEQGGERAETLCDLLYPNTGRARIVGITGAAGTGKSTLTRALAKAAAQRGLRVGILAIDPTSPYSGGSILGDRIRMNDIATSGNVFIRSMATRGVLGGLCAAAADGVDLLDASGRDLIFVETVGVGQDEVDVMEIAHTIVVVSVPGLGDDIQMLKAGILEIADIHAVNKSDLPGSDRVVAGLEAMLMEYPSRNVPVLACSAAREEGTEAVFDAILRHDIPAERRAAIVKARVSRLVRDLLTRAVERSEENSREILGRVANREISPRECARRLVSEYV